MALILGANSSFAQSANADINVSGSVSSGCVFTQGSFTGDFGVVQGSTVGKTQTNVSLICSDTLPYSLSFDSSTGGSNVVVKVYDATYTTNYNTTTKINGTGTGGTETFPLYFKLLGNGTCVDLGEGCVVTTKNNAMTATVPMTLAF